MQGGGRQRRDFLSASERGILSQLLGDIPLEIFAINGSPGVKLARGAEEGELYEVFPLYRRETGRDYARYDGAAKGRASGDCYASSSIVSCLVPRYWGGGALRGVVCAVCISVFLPRLFKKLLCTFNGSQDVVRGMERRGVVSSLKLELSYKFH